MGNSLLYFSTRQLCVHGQDEATQLHSEGQTRSQLRSMKNLVRVLLAFMIIVASAVSLRVLKPLYKKASQLEEPFILPVYAKFTDNTLNEMPAMSLQHLSRVDFNWPHNRKLREKEQEPKTYYHRLGAHGSIGYFAELYLATKPYYLLLDTGSEITWVYCDYALNPEKPAAGPNGLYNPSYKNLFQCRGLVTRFGDMQPCGSDGELLCKEIKYAGGTTTHIVLAYDVFLLCKVHAKTIKTRLIFGCAHKFEGNQTMLHSRADGILGLSPALYSLPSQLALKHMIKHIVGHCYERFDTEIPKGPIGYMFMGDEAIPLQKSMMWTPLVAPPKPYDRHRYFIGQLNNFKIGTFSYEFKEHKNDYALFDTGTTLTGFVPDIYQLLISYIETQTSKNGYKKIVTPYAPEIGHDKVVKRILKYNTECWFRPIEAFSKSWHKDFGSIILTFYKKPRTQHIKAEFEIKPSQYLHNMGNDSNGENTIICLWISEIQTTSTSWPYNLIGGVALQGYFVAYDFVKNRIGWSRTKNCSRKEMVAKIIEKNKYDLQKVKDEKEIVVKTKQIDINLQKANE